MSWRDELDKLDADLADGRINAGQHRKRADDLLAEASGPSPGATPATSRAAPRRHAQPERTEHEQAPAETGTQHAAGEQTQRARSDSGPGQQQREQPDDLVRDPQRLRTPPWQRTGVTAEPRPAERPALPREPPQEPTFPAVPPREPAPAQPQPIQQQPRQPPAPQGQPLAPGPAPTGIERITEPARRRRRLPPRRWVLGGAAAVVVLLLVAAGVWALLPGTGQDRTATRPRAAAPPATTPAPSPAVPPPEPAGPAVVPENLDASLPALPGKPLRANHTRPVSALVDGGYYSAAIAKQITAAGTKSMLLHESVRAGKEIYALAALPSRSPRGCQATAAVVNDYQRALGLTEAAGASPAANMVTLSRAYRGAMYYRSTYCAGKTTVILAAATADMAKAGSLRDGFTETGKAVTRTLPPN